MKTRSDTVLRKIYLSLYLKGLCVRGNWRPNRTATYWTPTLLAITAFLSCSPELLNWRPGDPLCWVLVFSTASYLQLVWSPTAQLGAWGLTLLGAFFLSRILSPTGLVFKTNWLPVFTELYNSSTSTFLWVSRIALIQPIHVQGYNILIDRMHLLFTKVHFLFWPPGRVVGQYTTLPGIVKKKLTKQTSVTFSTQYPSKWTRRTNFSEILWCKEIT